MWGFFVDEDEVSVRLGDANHVVAFTPRGVRGALLQPDAEQDRLVRALQLIVEMLELDVLVRPIFDFQWLVAVGGSYDDVRSGAATQFLPGAPGRRTDVAGWLDGELEGGKSYMLECGILEAIEAPRRLARSTGRFVGDEGAAAPSLWPVENLPEVAFFCDIQIDIDDELKSADDFVERWKNAEADAQQVVSSLMNRFELAPLDE